MIYEKLKKMLLKIFRNIKIKEKQCLLKGFRRFISSKLKL